MKNHILLMALAALCITCSCKKHKTAPSQYNSISYLGHTTLSEGRQGLAGAATGAKIIFAGGVGNSGQSNTIDVFDVNTNQWTTSLLLTKRNHALAVSSHNKIYITGDYGAAAVEVYNPSTNKCTLLSGSLSEERAYMTAAAAGNKVLVAGGKTPMGPSNTVDIYNVSDNKWSIAHLSVARTNLGSASLQNKILFAGGYSSSGFSNAVDIYDASTGKWTTASLSVARLRLAGAATGNKIVFAGGINASGFPDAVDIYDVKTNTWTTAHLSEARADLAAVAQGNIIVFAGGTNSYAASNTVDIYNVSTNTWSTSQLSDARSFLAGATAGNKIVFAGGNSLTNGGSRVDIFQLNK